MIDTGLNGKVALITGANHGIGSATAKALAAQGAKVFISFYREATRYSGEELKQAQAAGIGGDVLYRARQQQSADATIESIRSQGGVAQAYEADLSNPDNIPRLFDLCQTNLGDVDVLVNNHTYCVSETFDPARVTKKDGGVRLTTVA